MQTSSPRPAARRRLSRRAETTRRALPPWVGAAWDYVLIALGCVFIAASFSLLLNGNRIVSGGLIGISTLVYSRFHVEPAVTQLAVNVPLFALGAWLLGGRFGAKTLTGLVLLPLCIFLTRHQRPLTDNLLLASLYGGIGTGVGLGLLFRGGGSVGGTSLAAQIVARYSGLGLGTSLLLFDGVIIAAASVTLGPEPAMYGLICLFVTKRAIDVVQSGLSTSKMALIICRDAAGVAAVRTCVLEDLDRGLTVLSGSGGFTGEERPVLMVVVSPGEVARLKALVHAADPGAFVILSDAAEVFGEGFQRYRLR